MTERQRTAAVMFVDISGSTRLYEALGDAAAHARVEACLALLRRECLAYGGRVMKTTGDGALCEFPSADAALESARSMHEAVAAGRETDGTALGIHIGCHLGPVIESGGDLYGDAVNLAARVAGLAKVGQVILTEHMARALSASFAGHARSLDRVTVKGKREDVQICEYLWQDADELTMMGTASTLTRTARLVLRHEGREVALAAADATEATFGRDGGCDFVIEDRKASRQHARIERRRDKFVLIDHSSNGTWVRMGGAPAVVLRREEIMLQGQGAIGFGHSPDAEGAVTVEFVVV
jgi:class 3 adenylate cyclase